MTPAQTSRYNDLKRELAELRDPVGGFTTFGSRNCQGSSGAPAIQGLGSPRLGGSYTVVLQNGARSQPALLATGSSRSAWAGVPLPLPLPLPLPAAGRIDVWIDRESHVVQRMELRWPHGQHAHGHGHGHGHAAAVDEVRTQRRLPQLIHTHHLDVLHEHVPHLMEFEFVGTPVFAERWFDAATHSK